MDAYEQEKLRKEKAQNDSSINAVSTQLDTVTARQNPVFPTKSRTRLTPTSRLRLHCRIFMFPITARPNRWRNFKPVSTNWRCRTRWHSSRLSSPMRWNFSKGLISLPLSIWAMATAIIRLRLSPDEKVKQCAAGSECDPQCGIDIECRHKRARLQHLGGIKRSVVQKYDCRRHSRNQSVTNGQSVKLRTTEPM